MQNLDLYYLSSEIIEHLELKIINRLNLKPSLFGTLFKIDDTHYIERILNQAYDAGKKDAIKNEAKLS